MLTTAIQQRFQEIVAEMQHELQMQVISSACQPAHIHLLLDVDPLIGIYKVVCAIKGRTSKLLRAEFPELKRKLPTLWTRSKFIATVGAVSVDQINAYISAQKGI